MEILEYNDKVKLVRTIPICGCGTPEDSWNWLTEYLDDLQKHNWNKYKYEDNDWKYIQIINGFLEDLDIVEHGTTCRCSWLTETGEKILKTLKYMQKYDFEFNPPIDSEYGKWFWKVKKYDEGEKNDEKIYC